MLKTFKYRIYPGPGQRRKLEATLESCRWLYNHFLGARKDTFDGTGYGLSFYEQRSTLPSLKIIKSELSAVYSQVLQDVTARVDRAFKAFFRRVKAKETPGYPRFKGVGRYTSFTYPQVHRCGVRFKDGKLELVKLGLIKIKLHRPLEGKPKTCTVLKTPTGKWYVTFQCECEEPRSLPKNDLKVGIDLGLKTFAQFSDGAKIENPRFFKKEEKALAKAQRRLSKTEKKSKERNASKKIVARVYERIGFKRHDFCHQWSRRLINKYQVICLEDLNKEKMLETDSRPLRKSMSDVCWGKFAEMLEVKAAWAGRQVIKVNPAYTTQDCHKCGHRQKMSLSDREYNCQCCNLSIDRDLNASLNILRLGQQSQRTA